jgi:transposase
MPTSPDTVLRRVQAADLEAGPPPRYVGLDDWAIRKGQNYGTMVVDLERGRVVALLPGRDGEAVAEWLRANPQVEVISRDRWPAYAKAATEAAPQATQVADRWHLLKNLREAVENLLARMTPEIQTAACPKVSCPNPLWGVSHGFRRFPTRPLPFILGSRDQTPGQAGPSATCPEPQG